MKTRLLIDASYPEETRVATVVNNVLEDYDYETSSKKQLKGNIYIAEIMRIEKALQAAFVQYEDDKFGFLPFSEINTDYLYNEEDDNTDLALKLKQLISSRNLTVPELKADDNMIPITSSDVSVGHTVVQRPAPDVLDLTSEEENMEAVQEEQEHNYESNDVSSQNMHEKLVKGQLLLVQVIKEERGNKGATLTTNISLAGRYCVLMPNSQHNGGISRRIANPEARKKIKDIIDQLTLPEGVGVIIRTAGADRSCKEIKQDYDYLVRLWNNITAVVSNNLTPCFIHAESNIIKRIFRDDYDINVNEIIVQGEQAYKSAKDFISNIMSDQLPKLKPYKSKVPIFSRYNVEDQISSMFDTNVPLVSGGYLVINPTEALTAIDINSGKSTAGGSIAETALQTNLEAAQEIARQLRFRDVSGLVVIDFIDMINPAHRDKVESAFRNALQKDRAKIQVSRISMLGLLEMSRQRLRSSFIESHTQLCLHCNGEGRKRTIETVAIEILRSLEVELVKGSYESINIHLSYEHAAYLFNFHKSDISQIEYRHKVRIFFMPTDHLIGQDYIVERNQRVNSLNVSKRKISTDDSVAYRNIQEKEVEQEESNDNVEIIDEVLKSSKEGAYRRPQPRKNKKNIRNTKYKKRTSMQKKIRENSQEPELELVGAEGAAANKPKQEAPSLLKELWKRIID